MRESAVHLQHWASEQAIELNDLSINNPLKDITETLNNINHPGFYQKHLLESIVSELNGDDITAVD